MSMDVESWDTMPTTIWDSVQRVITLVGVDTVLLLLALFVLFVVLVVVVVVVVVALL